MVLTALICLPYECWHLDNGASSKIDDFLTENGGLLHVLPLAVLLNFFLMDK